jgi:hypothetical protein
MKMKRVTTIVFVVAASLVLSLSATSANLFGANTKATPVSGEYALDLVTGFIPESVTQLSPNTCIMKVSMRFDFFGDVEGEMWVDLKIIHHGSCDFAAGPEPGNFHGQGLFVGTVGSAEGALECTVVGKHLDDGGVIGKLVIQKGYDELAGLHGLLRQEGIVGVGGVYSGTVHVAP